MSSSGGNDDTTTVGPAKGTSPPPALGHARLLVLAGRDAGRYVNVDARTVVGRGSECALVLQDPGVSRQHIEIVREQDGFVVEDLGSKNGTLLNERPLRRARITMGDRLQLGATLLVFMRTDEFASELAQRERLELVGRLTSGIVHDLNNMFSVFLTNGEAACVICADTTVGGADLAELRDILGDVIRAARNGAALTRQLLGAVHKTSDEQQDVDLSAIVVDAATLARRAMSSQVKLQVSIVPDLWVHGDPTKLHQVVLNLLVNARDAVGRFGTVALRMEADESRRAAVLSVQDDGCGMDEATRHRIFEPFFTTKGSSGTGIGLATTSDIVAAHGGAIDVRSQLGEGSCFTVSLPLLARPAARAAERRNTPLAPRPTGAGNRVFVVDRDPGTRRAICRALSRAGYDVLETATAPALLHACAELRPDAIVMECSDDVYDDELIARLRRVREIAPVLVLGDGGPRPSALDAAGVTNFVSKPFSLETLLAALETTITSERR